MNGATCFTNNGVLNLKAVPSIVNRKNQWLYDQVEVEFPTAPSLRGRALYLESLTQNTCLKTKPRCVNDEMMAGAYLVDVHRLTIMFALMHAEKFRMQSEKEDVIEFFTQIILSPPCQLYLGFDSGQPVAAGIVTKAEQALLISDIVIVPNSLYPSEIDFASVLIRKTEQSGYEYNSCYIECHQANVL